MRWTETEGSDQEGEFDSVGICSRLPGEVFFQSLMPAKPTANIYTVQGHFEKCRSGVGLQVNFFESPQKPGLYFMRMEVFLLFNYVQYIAILSTLILYYYQLR